MKMMVMGMNRAWLLRASVGANLMVLCYWALYSSSSTLPSLSSSPSPYPSDPTVLPPQLTKQLLLQQSQSSQSQPQTLPVPALSQPQEALGLVAQANGGNGVVWDGDDSALGEGIAADLVSPSDPNSKDGMASPPAVVEVSVNDTSLVNKSPLEPRLFPCDDYTPAPFTAQRGGYWVLYNHIRGERAFRCDQSVTYTTHADFTFLDNLIPLLERWQGPLSLAMYSPGTDYAETVSRILYLRECSPSPLVKDLVTFHLFFDGRHVPKTKLIRDPAAAMSQSINCSSVPPPTFGDNLPTYKKTKKLPYPVNVARNVAREMATTHFILPSDIELYPNPNLITDFIDMIRLNDSNLQRPNQKVFVLSIFEVEANVSALPQDKRDLIHMLSNKTAIPFHKYVCMDCHRIPKAKEWSSMPFVPGVRVFHIGKRHKPYHHWEPIFIGTKDDPYYDERLSWEGRSDKMTQGYILCVKDYEFHILDNGFLVHRPGIKRNKVIPQKNPVVARQNRLISSTILPELKLVFGTRPGCVV